MFLIILSSLEVGIAENWNCLFAHASFSNEVELEDLITYYLCLSMRFNTNIEKSALTERRPQKLCVQCALTSNLCFPSIFLFQSKFSFPFRRFLTLCWEHLFTHKLKGHKHRIEETEKQKFPSPQVHFIDAHNSQVWTGLKLETGKPILVSQVGDREPTAEAITWCLPIQWHHLKVVNIIQSLDI